MSSWSGEREEDTRGEDEEKERRDERPGTSPSRLRIIPGQ